MIPVALAENHLMLRTAMVHLIEGFGEYKIVLQASNGHELFSMINPTELPELVLMEMTRPHSEEMASVKLISEKYPQIKMIALIADETDIPVALMIKLGVRGYIQKDAGPDRLREAMANVLTKGFHIPERLNGRLMNSFQSKQKADHKGNNLKKLTEREKEFLRFSCTEMTYKEIALKMEVSPRTVDGYRDGLFEKLGVKSRVGLAIYAIRWGIVKIT